MNLYYPEDPTNTTVTAPDADGFDDEHRHRHDRRAGVVRRALPAGSVDAQPLHAERRGPLRPRRRAATVRPVSDRTSSCRCRRRQPTTAAGAARSRQRACATTTSRRAGVWRGTCSAPARRRSSGTWASTWRRRASAVSTPTTTRAPRRTTTLTPQLGRPRTATGSFECNLADYNANTQPAATSAAACTLARNHDIRRAAFLKFGRPPLVVAAVQQRLDLRPHARTRRRCTSTALLRGVRAEPDVRVGSAPQRVAVRARHSARAAAASVGGGHLQLAEVRQPHATTDNVNVGCDYYLKGDRHPASTTS